MYEELLNFLLARKKRLLSEEEADRLMELITQSMEAREGREGKEDNTALIRKILENVDMDQAYETDTESMENAMEDLLFDGYSSEIYSNDTIDLSESDNDTEPLSERKFQRGEFRAGVKASENEEEPKRRIGLKDKAKEGEWKDLSGGKDNDLQPPKDSTGVLSEDGEGPKRREFKLPGFSKEKKERSFEMRDGGDFNLPGSVEFEFDLGELKKVNNTGPNVKFFDEDGEEI
ncbi:uncharacterized protein Eint_081060 [Encephalitozoon intestinalis ATCC 50506]|uniref:Uncharacterized protein n=1 Tax=Encephalitozoon intestinalis (strain ATCC 50506) TaxID=876142 RepID=E0S8S1_ENCIT|nr:uncharacterized protein Eint_081060 [Encephalitozoon intestinalis ATCC 50506]ADM12038.1 hypothetical protein Eint_081060 [Encephalitozoon intestinalis ATCC 50506]UTX45827.1 hypothetical protein GPK93_08g14060 [Encephalitozoon intestinalis]